MRLGELGPFGGHWRAVIIGTLLAATVGLHATSGGGRRLAGVRAGVTLAFMLVGPGLALIGLLHLDDLMLEISLALALSLALETLLAMSMLLLKHWVPSTGLSILEVEAAAGALAQVVAVQKLKGRNHHPHVAAG